jgi:hypothetical protein
MRSIFCFALRSRETCGQQLDTHPACINLHSVAKLYTLASSLRTNSKLHIRYLVTSRLFQQVWFSNRRARWRKHTGGTTFSPLSAVPGYQYPTTSCDVMALHHNSGKLSLRHTGDVFKVLCQSNKRAPRAEDVWGGDKLHVFLASALNNNNNNNKSDNSSNRGNWNHLKLIQKIPQQHTCKARNQMTTQNSHTGHCTHTAESTKRLSWEITLHVPLYIPTTAL